MSRADWEETGRRLREARKKKGLRQEDVVTKSGIDRPTLSKFENGRFTGKAYGAWKRLPVGTWRWFTSSFVRSGIGPAEWLPVVRG